MNYADFGVKGPEELEQDEWSLHGGGDEGRPTDKSPFGGIRTVLGWKGYASNGSSKMYVVHCSRCAEDSELFGDGIFLTPRSNFLSRRQGFCGCSKRPYLTKDQVMVKMRRIALQRGHKVLGYAEDYHGKGTRLLLEDIQTGKRWSSTCVNNYHHSSVRSPKKTDLDLIAELRNTNPELEIIGIYINNLGKRMITFKCRICSQDEYVNNGLCSGVFTSHASDVLLKNTTSCRCSKSFLWTEAQMEYRVKMEIKKRNEDPARVADMTFHGWEGGRYRNNKTRLLYFCSTHGLKCSTVGNLLSGSGGCRECVDEGRGLRYTTEEFISLAREVHGDTYQYTSTVYTGWAVNVEIHCEAHGIFVQAPGSHLQGRGCPQCAGNSQRQAYINTVEDGGTPCALKVGISRDHEKRLLEQNRKNLFQSFVLGVWEFKEVKDCKAAERECKQTLQSGVLSAREMEDGHTETVSVLDLEKIIAIYEKHGGVRIK